MFVCFGVFGMMLMFGRCLSVLISVGLLYCCSFCVLIMMCVVVLLWCVL